MLRVSIALILHPQRIIAYVPLMEFILREKYFKSLEDKNYLIHLSPVYKQMICSQERCLFMCNIAYSCQMFCLPNLSFKKLEKNQQSVTIQYLKCVSGPCNIFLIFSISK